MSNNIFLSEEIEEEEVEEEEYDYSICPYCNGNSTCSITDDGGSIAFCNDCSVEFESIKP